MAGTWRMAIPRCSWLLLLSALDTYRGLLRPKVELRFLAEFLMRAVSATANDYGLRAPERRRFRNSNRR